MKLKRYIPLAAVTLGLIGSFFLPSAVASVMDARRLDNFILIDVQSVSFGEDIEMSIPERLALAASPRAEVQYLAAGQVMGLETAESQAVQELTRFLRGTPFEIAVDEIVVEDVTVAFVIDTEEPSVNMITWELVVLDQSANMAIITIDDETGVILKLIYQMGSDTLNPGGSEEEDTHPTPGDMMHRTARQIADMMAEYYGLNIGFGDYQLNGDIAYYRADMFEGGTFIPM